MLARKLGSYLRGARLIDYKNTVLVVSPMGRCVETAHAIAEGLTEISGREALAGMPIFIEDSLCEGAYWIHQDIVRNRSLRGAAYPPLPIYHNPMHHKEHTSPLVVGGLGLGPQPTFIKTAADELVEEPSVRERCRSGVRGLLKHKDFAGKVVICVGHGETCQIWANALSAVPISAAPTYTGFLEFMPQPAPLSGAEGLLAAPQGAGGPKQVSSVAAEKSREFQSHNNLCWFPQAATFGTPHDCQPMSVSGRST